MKEVFTMWKYTRMIVLVALSAAIYAALLIVFKAGFVIIPGITEVRPANVFPIIFGLMFGPAGAWGSAIGNTIGDLVGGTLGWGSIFGFFGNFFLGFIPYKMWGALGLVPQNDMSQNTNSLRKLLAYIIITITSAAACAIIIAWYLDLVGLIPFSFLAIVITLNNAIIELVLGPVLLLLLYPRVKRWGLIWTDIMAVEDVAQGFARQAGAILMIIGALGGLIIGIGISTGLYGQQLFQFGAGTKGQVGVWLSVLPFLIMIIIASFMLSGREQFVEEEE
ncbi:MAG: QueT transporter family protein [Chloroflexi bacterium]|nr:MAG: QueT transporter family protein [Chloroflexota bacterium]